MEGAILQQSHEIRPGAGPAITAWNGRLLWNWLKRHKLGKACVAGPNQFRTLADRYLRSLQKLPALIPGFFADRHLAYITQA